MPLANGLRVGEHALSDAQKIAIGRRVQRAEKLFELRLHFRLTCERRSKSANHFEKKRVRVGASHAAIAEDGVCGIVKEQHVAQARLPPRRAGRARRGLGRLMNQSEAHGSRILASRPPRSVTALS